jgi:hypothetical protein
MHIQTTRRHRRGANQTLEPAGDELAGREIDELDTILRWEDDGGKIVEEHGSAIDLDSLPLVQME